MRRFLGVMFACAFLCGLAVVICATPPPPPPNPNPIKIAINCVHLTNGVDKPLFVVRYSEKDVTTLQWRHLACGGNAPAVVEFMGDTPLIDNNNKPVFNFQIPAKGESAEFKIDVPAPPDPASNEIYKFYKY